MNSAVEIIEIVKYLKFQRETVKSNQIVRSVHLSVQRFTKQTIIFNKYTIWYDILETNFFVFNVRI